MGEHSLNFRIESINDEVSPLEDTVDLFDHIRFFLGGIFGTAPALAVYPRRNAEL